MHDHVLNIELQPLDNHNVYCTGGTECLSCTSGSHSACALFGIYSRFKVHSPVISTHLHSWATAVSHSTFLARDHVTQIYKPFLNKKVQGWLEFIQVNFDLVQKTEPKLEVGALLQDGIPK